MSVIKFGLIGHPLGHSMSPYIHERIMDEMGIRGRYELYEVEAKDFGKEFPILLKELDGFNVTIPYKMDVVPFLEGLDDSAMQCQAVNTVARRRGFNTDREGFLKMGLDMKEKKVLLLGSGGVSHMMGHEAAAARARIWICSRNQEKAHMLADRLRDAGAREVHVSPEEELHGATDMDVVLNGTPVGMWPFCGEMPCPPDLFRPGQQVFDTIYNPAATRMVLRAKKAGAKAGGGLQMLFWQAVAAQKIWNPLRDFDDRRLAAILPGLAREMLREFPVKYVFTGFMGAGKTTIAKAVGKILKMPVFDLDEEIEKVRGCSIAEIFARDGEAGFRQAEAEVLDILLDEKGSALIAAGGGSVIQERVRESLRAHGAMTVYLHAPFDVLWMRIESGTARPLAGKPGDREEERFSKAARLYEVRLPVYESYCDIRINAEKERDAVISDVISALGYGG